MSVLALVDHAVHLGLHHHADPDDGGAVARGAEEGGRGRPQEDQPVHALRHGDPGGLPGLRHRRRPGEPGRLGRPGGDRSRPVLPLRDRRHPGRRHAVPDVAGRADHRARRRQRRLADHLRRHRGGAAQRHDPDPRARPHRRAVGAVHHRAGDRRGASWWRSSCSSRRRSDEIVVQYPKRQVGNRMYGGEASHLPLKINTSGVIPPIFASSLLLFPATIASFQGSCRRARLGAVDRHLSRPRPAALPAGLYRPDRLLLLLLHHGGLQPDRHGRQPEEERRLRARHPSRQEHRRVPGIHPEPPDRDRRALPLGGLHPARAADRPRRRAVLLRRHQPR